VDQAEGLDRDGQGVLQRLDGGTHSVFQAHWPLTAGNRSHGGG
jgi:hypothetical protein